MAASSKVSGSSDTGIKPWHVALAVGVPAAIGVAGYLYYKSRKGDSDSSESTPADEAKSEGDKKGVAANTTSHVESERKEEPKPKSPSELAKSVKDEGNKLFKAGKYEDAIKKYSEAMALCPSSDKANLSTFYQNRAAAYDMLKQYKEVVEDCSKALELNSKYTKAYSRRSKAHEQLENFAPALDDITAVCILESFQKQESLIMADRVLKELGKQRAAEAVRTKEPQDPSPQFVKSYFIAFAHDPVMMEVRRLRQNQNRVNGRVQQDAVVADATGDAPGDLSPYQLAVRAVRDGEYGEVLSLCSQQMDLTEQDTERKEEGDLALLLRATFRMLRGESQVALDDFTTLLARDNLTPAVACNALVKRGSLYLQMAQKDKAIQDLHKARDVDPNNSDVYHHLGQVSLLLDDKEALNHFDKCFELNPNFPVAYMQRIYTEYRFAMNAQDMGGMATCCARFDEAVKKFPDCSEGFALYGQSLSDMQRFGDADKMFSKALELEPENPNIHVHKGLLALQARQDVAAAKQHIGRALTMDPKCEFAHETLGTIELQQGNLDAAKEHFQKAIDLSRTELEMGHLYSLIEAAQAQVRAARMLGVPIPQAMSGM